MDARTERLMPGGIPRWIRLYDNGGCTIDRYTCVFTGRIPGKRPGVCFHVFMSMAPSSPQGVGMWGEAEQMIDRPAYGHLGRRITFADLPEQCQRLIIGDYCELWGLPMPDRWREP